MKGKHEYTDYPQGTYLYGSLRCTFAKLWLSNFEKSKRYKHRTGTRISGAHNGVGIFSLQKKDFKNQIIVATVKDDGFVSAIKEGGLIPLVLLDDCENFIAKKVKKHAPLYSLRLYALPHAFQWYSAEELGIIEEEIKNKESKNKLLLLLGAILSGYGILK